MPPTAIPVSAAEAVAASNERIAKILDDANKALKEEAAAASGQGQQVRKIIFWYCTSV